MPPIGPPLYFYTIEVDDLANFITVTENFIGSAFGSQSIKVDTNEAVYKVKSDGNISQGTPESLHNITTDTDYQTSGSAKVILEVTGTNATSAIQFKVWESSAADTASGTAKYTFTNSTLDSGEIVTTPLMTFAASKYITIEVTTASDVVTVKGFVIE